MTGTQCPSARKGVHTIEEGGKQCDMDGEVIFQCLAIKFAQKHFFKNRFKTRFCQIPNKALKCQRLKILPKW